MSKITKVKCAFIIELMAAEETKEIEIWKQRASAYYLPVSEIIMIYFAKHSHSYNRSPGLPLSPYLNHNLNGSYLN